MFSLSVPSKTFLIGEYSALNGGPALLLATPPRFVLRSSLCLGPTCRRTGLEGQGPASVLLRNPAFDDYEFHFIDPHGGRGGLGASSAQFVLLHAFYNWLKFQPTKADRLLGAYRDVVRSQSEVMPSGYDVLSQFKGHLSFIHWKASQFDTVEWTLTGIDVILIRGPKKIATHTHLKELALKDTSEFEGLALNAYRAIQLGQQEDFVRSIQEFSGALRAHKLTIPESVDMQELVARQRGVRAVKGCGALGSDVIAVVVEQNEKARVLAWLESQRFEVVSMLSQRCQGLKVDEMSHDELQSKFEAEINFYREEPSGSPRA
ncbi:MAG TPA: hypothetical protein VFV50_04690 [Bdellovibrionales bacterium]|nr:hypothetical protein [Bdellovibrionales bacterium]